ncbi:MAG TPA: extracellular solute-binding protein [Candidatus Acidoferrales bacterium]|nr:extracellular solute-binding protein [Candidatus Acidoferrales bacterium]
MRQKTSAPLFATCVVLVLAFRAFAGEAHSVLLKAKQAADARGYAFFASRDEIVARAKKEGKLRISVNMEVATLKAASKAFAQKYPFIDLYAQEITGVDMVQRSVLEIKSGQAKDWDVIYASRDLYSEFLPYLWKVDLLGMAEHGVLQIPPPMIDPKNRNIGAFYTRLVGHAYNNGLLSRAQVPKTWEDYLKPEFKGRKFAADITTRSIASLVPAWGFEKTLDFARKLAAQQPIWVRGVSRTLTAMMAGEVPLMIGTMFHTVKRAQAKDRAGVLQQVLLEPVPVYLHSEQAIPATSQNPHAALLWLEWMASAESQKIADEHEPLGSSHYFRGGAVEQQLRGKKLSWVSWDNHANLEPWMAKVFEAYGFPKAER